MAEEIQLNTAIEGIAWLHSIVLDQTCNQYKANRAVIVLAHPPYPF